MQDVTTVVEEQGNIVNIVVSKETSRLKHQDTHTLTMLILGKVLKKTKELSSGGEISESTVCVLTKLVCACDIKMTRVR